MAKSVKYNLFNAKLTTVISISLVLVLLGITCMVLLMSKNLTDHVRENFIFKLTLKESVDSTRIHSLQAELANKYYTKDVKFVSKDEALENCAKYLGEDPLEALDGNPLPNCFDISLQADQIMEDSLKKIQDDLASYKEIAEFDYQQDLFDDLSHNVKKWSAVFLLLASVLLVISFALINNTMRLLIYADRFLIHTMQQVGATRSFIRKPYLKQGLLIGLFASALAIVFLMVLLFCMGDLSEDISLYLDLHNLGLIGTTCGVVLLSGVVITEIATFLAVNKYLKRSLNDLYLI